MYYKADTWKKKWIWGFHIQTPDTPHVSSIITSTVIAIDIVLVALDLVSSCDLCFHIHYEPHSPLKLYTE